MSNSWCSSERETWDLKSLKFLDQVSCPILTWGKSGTESTVGFFLQMWLGSSFIFCRKPEVDEIDWNFEPLFDMFFPKLISLINNPITDVPFKNYVNEVCNEVQAKKNVQFHNWDTIFFRLVILGCPLSQGAANWLQIAAEEMKFGSPMSQTGRMNATWLTKNATSSRNPGGFLKTVGSCHQFRCFSEMNEIDWEFFLVTKGLLIEHCLFLP